MNWAHTHIMLNHLTLVMMVLISLLLVISIKKKKIQLIKISLVFVILVAVWTTAAFVTGYPAREMIISHPSISEEVVTAHEKMAMRSLILTGITGLFAAAALITHRIKKNLFSIMNKITLAGLILSVALIACTANLGGRISHPEIRNSKAPDTNSNFYIYGENYYD